MESSGGGVRGALERIRHAPMWVWLTVLLTAGLLIFAYLQYRKGSAGDTSNSSGSPGSSAALGTVPADGSGQPLWNTADTSGFVAGNVTDLAALLAYLKSQNTPNPPTTATPTTQYRTITLQKPTSFNDLAKQYTNGQTSWLISWNRNLSNLPGYQHPWWTLPAGTVVKIPYRAAA